MLGIMANELQPLDQATLAAQQEAGRRSLMGRFLENHPKIFGAVAGFVGLAAVTSCSANQAPASHTGAGDIFHPIPGNGQSAPDLGSGGIDIQNNTGTIIAPTAPDTQSVPVAAPEQTKSAINVTLTSDMRSQALAPTGEGGMGISESGVQAMIDSIKKLSEYPEVWSKVTSNKPLENAQGLCAANEAAFRNNDISVIEAVYGGQDAVGLATNNIQQMRDLIASKQESATNLNPIVDYSCTFLQTTMGERGKLGSAIGDETIGSLGSKLEKSKNGVVSNSINAWNNGFYGTNYDVAGLMTERVKFIDGSEKELRNEPVLTYVWQQRYESNGSSDNRIRFIGSLTNVSYYQN